MRLTQGTFSFLPDLTDEQLKVQVRYLIDNGWAVNVEHTDDPHPRNTYWEMWGLPLFDLGSPQPVLDAVDECRAAHPNDYIRLSAFDATKGWESLRSSFIVQRPPNEPGFGVERAYRTGRSIGYAARAYAAEQPPGERYR